MKWFRRISQSCVVIGILGRAIVDGRGVDVGDLLVELALRDADLADTLQLLLEIPIGNDGTTRLDALIVHHVGLDRELLDDARGPLAELYRPLGIDLVTHRDDGGQVVVLGVVAFAVGGSYPEFPDN